MVLQHVLRTMLLQPLFLQYLQIHCCQKHWFYNRFKHKRARAIGCTTFRTNSVACTVVCTTLPNIILPVLQHVQTQGRLNSWL